MVAGLACAHTMADESGEGCRGDKREKMAGERPRHGEMMKKADRDGDGKVTLEEFTDMHMERIREKFQKLDRNKDGVLSEDDKQGRGCDKAEDRKSGRKKKGGSPEDAGQAD